LCIEINILTKGKWNQIPKISLNGTGTPAANMKVEHWLCLIADDAWQITIYRSYK
jgi:hypothetical protein